MLEGLLVKGTWPRPFGVPRIVPPEAILMWLWSRLKLVRV